MNKMASGGDELDWQDHAPTIGWQEALDRLAPPPEVVEGKEPPHPAIVARHLAAQFIAGTLGEVVPVTLIEPKVQTAVRSIARQITDIKGLPDGWQGRHRQLQKVANPELADAFEHHDNSGKRKKVMSNTVRLNKLADATLKLGDWVDRAFCKDENPDIFHPIFKKGASLDTRLEYVEAIHEKFCNNCDVRSECLEFGKETRQFDDLDSIFDELLRRKTSHGSSTQIDSNTSE